MKWQLAAREEIGIAVCPFWTAFVEMINHFRIRYEQF